METRKIKKYSLPYTEEDKKFVLENIATVLDNGYLTDGGEYVAKFEAAWANIVGAKHAIAVNSCTTALELILKVIDVEGSSVVVPTYTFFATPLSVHLAGGTVQYADISRSTMSLSLESIQKAATEDTKAVIIVHVGGIITNEIVRIREWCDKNNIYLVEDAACAHGASFEGSPVGSFGHFTAFSFHHSKVLTSGEGCIITTDNEEYDTRFRRFRAIGLDRSINNWEVFEIGNNYKLPETSAVLGLLHCNKSEEIFEERRSIAAHYDCSINFNDNLAKFTVPPGVVSGHYKYIAIAKSREYKTHLTKTLAEKYNIHLPPTTYEYMCHEQGINGKIDHEKNSDFKNARHMMEHNICLPLYCGLSKEDLKYITESINEIIC